MCWEWGWDGYSKTMPGDTGAEPYLIVSFQIDHRREQGVAGRGRRKIPGLKMQDVVVEREQSTVV